MARAISFVGRYLRWLGEAIVSIFRYLGRGWDRLGQVPSVAFGLAYVVAIPVFALIYYIWLPYSFYHATVRYEPFVFTQIGSLSANLRDAFLNAANSDNEDRPTINDVPISIATDPSPIFPAFYIQPEPDRIRIIALFRLRQPPPPDMPIYIDPLLRVALDLKVDALINLINQIKSDPANIKVIQMTEVLGAMPIFVEVQATILSSHDVSLPHLFPCQGDRKRTITCLLMTSSDLNTLLLLQATVSGAPRSVEPNYLRMLYFSAVTITTLGYGDIVPITSWARGVVTVEIILGPLLFGFFLNSLAKEHRN